MPFTTLMYIEIRLSYLYIAYIQCQCQTFCVIILDIHRKIKGPSVFEIQSPENMTLGKTGSYM